MAWIVGPRDPAASTKLWGSGVQRVARGRAPRGPPERRRIEWAGCAPSARADVSRLHQVRPTILDRYVVREVLPPSAIGLLLFTFIVLLDQIPQLLKILVSRGADFGTVARALLYLLPSIFSITIPMSFLLGVLLAFGRMASESEIVAIRASGISPARLLRPVMALSLAAMMMTFYVMAVALPAANQAYREIVFALVISKARTGVKPRVFTDNDLVPGMILYVSDVPTETGRWRNVFIHDQRNPQKPRTILAKAGQLVIDRDRKYVALELEDGVVHVFNPVEPTQYNESRFRGRAILPLPFEEFFPQVPLSKGDREMSIPELRDRIRQLKSEGRKEWTLFAVELHKKFAIPVACVVFGLLGLGLSLGSKKEARSAAFALSIAIIFVYYVIIRLGEQAGDTQLIPPAVAMWAANVVLGAAALVLLVLNHREAAFDPLDPGHYKALLPTIRRALPVGDEPPVPVKGRRPPPRPVVVIRLPRWHLPLPGILDRYVVRSFFGHLALVLLSFWAIFVLVDFTGNIFDDIQHNKVKGVVVLHYYTFQSPYLLQLLAPAAVLVSVLTTFGILARRNEITAMKAGGISVYRATFPVVAIGFVLTVGSFLLSELVLPATNRIADRDFNIIKGRPPQASSLLERRWLVGNGGRLYNFDFVERGPRPGGLSLYGLSIYQIDEAAWQLSNRLYAARAVWTGRGYDLERGHRQVFGEPMRMRPFQHQHATDIEPPSWFGQEQRASDTLSFGELRRHIRTLEARGFDVVSLRVQLHRKLSFPAVSLVMVLIGIPFSFVVARRGALYGIALAILISIVYWACLAVFEALGNSGLLPAVLASWTPNVLFGTAGLYLLFTVET
jgi:LPS export ABC transporter permease LptF/LPS export ABC transporter permease LptG